MMQKVKSLPVVDVYVAAIPEIVAQTELYPKARQDEIDSASNPRVKTEKRCVWKLLEHALKSSFGLSMKQLDFEKNDHGKWTTQNCFFSLSHCDGAVAVAVSSEAVGVDIEAERGEMRERLAGKILNADEYKLYEQGPDDKRARFLLERWTAKESLFKRDAVGAAFIPSEHSTLSGKTDTKSVWMNGREYVLSVATEATEVIRTYTDVDLSQN